MGDKKTVQWHRSTNTCIYISNTSRAAPRHKKLSWLMATLPSYCCTGCPPRRARAPGASNNHKPSAHGLYTCVSFVVLGVRVFLYLQARDMCYAKRVCIIALRNRWSIFCCWRWWWYSIRRVCTHTFPPQAMHCCVHDVSYNHTPPPSLTPQHKPANSPGEYYSSRNVPLFIHTLSRRRPHPLTPTAAQSGLPLP